MKLNNKSREPLLHVSKNDATPAWLSLTIRIAAIVIALIAIGILSMILIHENPIKIYKALFTGPLIDKWTLLQDVALMLMFGLAVIPAFRMKFWNMGANGQVLVGCLAAIACMKFLAGKNIPSVLFILIMFAASVSASIIWAVIPAIFKAFFNTNETLFTLMMNYIAIAIVNLLVFTWDKSGQGNIGIVNLFTGKEGWIPNIADNKYLLPIIVALVFAVIMFVYIRFTKHGFEVDLVGESVNTAKYVGINVKKVIIRTLVFSGLICGVLGFLYAGAISHTINESVGGKGFTAILVAWLANFNPLIMILTSFFVVYVNSGAEYISTAFGLASNDYANIVVGIIFFFVIGCEFFIRYKLQINPYWKNKLSKGKKKEDNKQ